MSSWSVVTLDFSMQSAITAIGVGSAINVSSDPASAGLARLKEVRIACR
jgi:hypothetical protein